jgi:hypothetical protein
MTFSLPVLRSVVASIIAALPPGPEKERTSAMETNVPGVEPSRPIMVPWALKAEVAIVASYTT